MGRTRARAKCTTAVRAFDLPETSGSISGPGVEGGGGAEGEEGGRREGGEPHGQISQTGKPLDSYRISCGSFSLGTVKVTPGLPSRPPAPSRAALTACHQVGVEGGVEVGCRTGASDPGWRENAAALNMHGHSYRMSIIRLLVGLSSWQRERTFPGFFDCFSPISRPRVSHGGGRAGLSQLEEAERILMIIIIPRI